VVPVPYTDLNQQLAGGKMNLVKNLRSGVEVLIIVRRPTEERLRAKCFRGKHLALAGNFYLWDSAESLFRDRTVIDQLLEELHDLWTKRDLGTHSQSITHELVVGWESTDPLENYAPDDLELFNPNRRSQGLRVKLHRTDLFAPKTQELTLVYELKSEDSNPVVIIHSIYPGIDIGELDGNVTQREERVFLDWTHQGEI
jgi:hypothetical protein